MQQENAVFQHKAAALEDKLDGAIATLVVHIKLYIADSNPALKRQLSTSSSYTALKRAISSFSLGLTLVTNASRVTEASSSTAFFP